MRKTDMTSKALVERLRVFEDRGIEVWLDGGWAVDVLLETQTRPHKDVDIILRTTDLEKLRRCLSIKNRTLSPNRRDSPSAY